MPDASLVPAMLVAGVASNCGKTTVTLGLMACLREMGLVVQPFKCGPDFIDPTLHRLACGRASRNLDPWMAGEEFCRATFARQSNRSDVAVIEGVMGMFDGGASSSARLAGLLGVPVVLVVDVASAAESVAAMVKGFESLDPAVSPRAVILNRVASQRHLDLVRGAIEQHCRAEVVGYLPRDLAFAMPARHLGLFLGGEEPISRENLDRLATTIREHIDMERLLAIAADRPLPGDRKAGPAPAVACRPPERVKVRIGVALDKAFCFYYEDNLELLHEAGGELVFFSPLADRTLPAGVRGLYLPGGYPELHARELAENLSMRRAVRQAAEKGLPIYAECGGLMYLTRGITDRNGVFQPMAGIFPTTAVMRERRAGLGYREVRLRADCPLGPAGTRLRGHEFHYSTIEAMPESVERLYAVEGFGREGYRLGNTVASYIHLHFGQSPEAARAWVACCKDATPAADNPAPGA